MLLIIPRQKLPYQGAKSKAGSPVSPSATSQRHIGGGWRTRAPSSGLGKPRKMFSFFNLLLSVKTLGFVWL